jgi:uroporphyrinogen-III synthase
MALSHMGACVLFKDCDDGDALSIALLRAGYAPFFCPVLETTLHSDRITRAVLDAQSAGRVFDAVVLSSHRAGEALAKADLPPDLFSKMPIFVVGHRTAASVRLALPALSAEMLVGAESGSAEVLAGCMIERLSALQSPSVLFCCGEKRLDVLPDKLSSVGIRVVEAVAYSTSPLSPASISAAFASHWHSSGAALAALVFFSPSGVHAATSAPSVRDALASCPCIALGPTTAKALTSAGIRVSGVASAPTPEGVLEAIGRALPLSKGVSDTG